MKSNMKYETKLAISKFINLKEDFLSEKRIVMFCDVDGNEYWFNYNLSEDEF
jgi:hypothetical protein